MLASESLRNFSQKLQDHTFFTKNLWFFIVWLMFYVPPAESTFTRSQLCKIAGVTDGVATFWIRHGILRPVSGGSGKGSHRLFDRVEVSNAAILGVLQSYGMNVARLSALAKLMHDARDICTQTSLSFRDIDSAARLRRVLDRFRAGEEVMKYVVIPDTSVRAGERVEMEPCANEQEVVAQSLDRDLDEDVESEIIRFADRLPTLQMDALRFYLDVVSEVTGCENSDPAWLIWPEGDSWGYLNSPDGLRAFPDLPSSQVSGAMYLAAGIIVRTAWGNSYADKEAYFWTRRLEENPSGRFADTIRERLAEHKKSNTDE